MSSNEIAMGSGDETHRESLNRAGWGQLRRDPTGWVDPTHEKKRPPTLLTVSSRWPKWSQPAVTEPWPGPWLSCDLAVTEPWSYWRCRDWAVTSPWLSCDLAVTELWPRRDWAVARTNLTQRNTWMKRDAKKPATCRSETFRGENTLRCDSKWNYVTLRKWCDVVHTNVTQCNIWIKRDVTKPAAWLNENITLRGEKIRDVATALYGFQNVGQHRLESMASLLGVCNIISHRVGGNEWDVTRNPR